MNIIVLYGTESGNAELVADDLTAALPDEVDAELADLQDTDPASLEPDTLYLIVCSTHGEGELPESAQPFADALDAQRPDLAGIRYAVFGMGDSTYEHYSRGSEHLDERLRALGAQRIGEYGRHDAASRESASELATTWAQGVLEEARQGVAEI